MVYDEHSGLVGFPACGQGQRIVGYKVPILLTCCLGIIVCHKSLASPSWMSSMFTRNKLASIAQSQHIAVRRGPTFPIPFPSKGRSAARSSVVNLDVSSSMPRPQGMQSTAIDWEFSAMLCCAIFFMALGVVHKWQRTLSIKYCETHVWPLPVQVTKAAAAGMKGSTVQAVATPPVNPSFLQNSIGWHLLATSEVALHRNPMATAEMEFFDIAANLTDGVFRGISYKGARLHEDDFEKMVERFKSVGVKHVLVSGTSYDICVQAVQLARKYPGTFYTTVGVHPAHSLEFDESGDPDGHLEKLRKLINENRDVVLAVGEVGVDYAELQECPKEVQLKYFEAQFALAEETGLPMFLHSRECGLDFVEIVERHRHRFSTGVVHSFTGSAEELSRLLAMGLSIGINGASLRTKEQVELIKTVPVDRLMLETDAPWCDIRKGNFGFADVKTQFETRKKDKFQMGKCVERRNEPCHIVQVFEVLAAHHPAAQGNLQQFAAQLYANSMNMFLSAKSHQSTAVS